MKARDGTAAKRAMILLVIVFTVALPRAGFVPASLRLPLTLGLVVVQGLFWFMLVFGRRWPEARELPKLAAVAAGFVLIVLIAGVTGVMRGGSLVLVIVEALALVASIPTFFLVLYLVRNGDDVRLAFLTVAACVAAIAAYGILQRHAGSSVLVPGVTSTSGTGVSERLIELSDVDMRKVLSSYGDPNVFAAALVLFFPFLMGLYAEGRGKARLKPQRILAGVAMALCVVAMVYSRSRAGYLGLGIGTLALWLRQPGAMSRAVLPVFLMLVIGSELQLSRTIRDEMVFRDDPRVVYVDALVDNLIYFPLGTGLAIGTPRFTSDGTAALRPASTVWDSYNSFYLHLLSRTGIHGLAVFIWLVLIAARRPWRTCHKQSEWRWSTDGLLCGLLGMQLALLVNPVYQLPGGGSNFWLALGLAWSANRICARSEDLPRR